MSEHAIREYLKTIGSGGGGVSQEIDPVFSASPAHGISAQDISEWNDKQDELVSGTNIKTINNESILGSGNIDVSSDVTDVEVNGESVVGTDGVAEVIVPTKVSDLINDIGYVTKNVWYATCDTSESTSSKVATTINGDFILSEGNVVKIKFTNASGSSTMHLNVDSTGSKSIAYVGSTISGYLWNDGEIVEFVYDGSRFVTTDGGRASTTNYGVTKLSSSTSSTSTSLAATPSAVKSAYDLANNKAPKASPAFTGTPTAPTASAGTNNNQIATTAFVKMAIDIAITGVVVFQGVAPISFAPADYKVGWCWVVGTVGTYVGEMCEVGDMIFATADYNSEFSASDFDVLQTNLDISDISTSDIDAIVV